MTDRIQFGERLRRARERRKLTLQEIAERTKLSATRLQALEDGTCAHWPAGVYSRSYIRDYAGHVGLDAAETVEEFVTLFPQLAFAEQDQHAEVVAVRTRPAGTGVAAPLRLMIDEPPMPFWRAWLMWLALALHRWATGAPRPVAVEPAPRAPLEEDRPGLVPAGVSAVPFGGLQVD